MLIRCFVLVCALLAAGRTTRAWADDRADAKSHYQAGTKLYAAGNYKDAVREFAAAEQLVPSGYNDYNLALCYDKLGDADPAIQYYRSYLKRVPDAANKSAVEASVARLDSAAKSAQAKSAEEAKKAAAAAEAKSAAEAAAAKTAADVKAAQAAADAQVAADAKAAADAAKAAPETAPSPYDTRSGVPAIPTTDPNAIPPTSVGSTGTPSSATTVSTGDAQLDRVSSIDINGIRDQRVGAAGSGMMDMRGGPATAAPIGAAGAAGPNGTNGVQGPANPNAPAEQAKETPIYKKWWFWVGVVVVGYVVYDIATTNSNNNNQNFARDRDRTTPDHMGLTLLHW